MLNKSVLLILVFLKYLAMYIYFFCLYCFLYLSVTLIKMRMVCCNECGGLTAGFKEEGTTPTTTSIWGKGIFNSTLKKTGRVAVCPGFVMYRPLLSI